jgi:hypothetical protein
MGQELAIMGGPVLALVVAGMEMMVFREWRAEYVVHLKSC